MVIPLLANQDLTPMLNTLTFFSKAITYLVDALEKQELSYPG